MSIIIVAHSNGKQLYETIESIYRYNDLENEIEVIVVDNSNEEPDIKKYCDSLTNINFKYIKVKNKGFGAGNNEGVKLASGEILGFINPDIILIEPIFKDIYNTMKNNKNIETLGCGLCDINMHKNDSFNYDFDLSIFQRLYLRICKKIGYFDSNKFYTSGANLFVWKNSFIKCGKFDENLFMYFEEPDIKRRLLKINKNAKFVYDKKKKIIHVGGGNSSVFTLKYYLESIVYYGKKYKLDYIKKLNFEYRYKVCKYIMMRFFLHKSDLSEFTIFKQHYKRIMCDLNNVDI